MDIAQLVNRVKDVFVNLSPVELRSNRIPLVRHDLIRVAPDARACQHSSGLTQAGVRTIDMKHARMLRCKLHQGRAKTQTNHELVHLQPGAVIEVHDVIPALNRPLGLERAKHLYCGA